MPPAPPPPRPAPTLAQQQREAARLLLRLDEMLKGTGELAARARERVSVGGLSRYRVFTKRVRDFFALAAVAEERILANEELAESSMMTALDRMHARMLVQFVEGSLAFFQLYTRVRSLPIGTHEMCGVELRGLLTIRSFLEDPRYDGERGQTLLAQADRVAAMMQEVMDRIPPLPDFGDAISIGPKGQPRMPVREPPQAKPPVVEPVAPPPPPPPPPAPTFHAVDVPFVDEDEEFEDDPGLEVRPLTPEDWDEDDEPVD